MAAELRRTYLCPVCGYEGFRADIKSTFDVNIQWGCPRCKTVDDLFVVLEETSDPRDESEAA